MSKLLRAVCGRSRVAPLCLSQFRALEAQVERNRRELELQFRRIAELQAELDALKSARKKNHARSLEIRVNKDDHAYGLVVTEDHVQEHVERFHLIRDFIARQQEIVVEQWHADGWQFHGRRQD